MINLRVRDFYKRSEYEGVPQYLLGMFICTFVLLPIAFFIRIADKIVK